jgi:hypothetical protein
VFHNDRKHRPDLSGQWRSRRHRRLVRSSEELLRRKWMPSDRRYSFPALDDVELNAWFALAWRKVRHQFEKRNFKSDRNPLKDRDISCLEAAFEFISFRAVSKP